MSEQYDSTNDTRKHQANIHMVIEDYLIPALRVRSINHDMTKLEEPEKSCYDKYIPYLKKYKYGTPEYLQVRQNMQKEGLDHHYAANRHHIEHFNGDISKMNLIDLFEMFADHYASSMLSDTGYVEGEKKNAERYGYSDQLYSILMNTYNDLIRPYENHMTPSREIITGVKEV